jgi:cardiolipin synthase
MHNPRGDMFSKRAFAKLDSRGRGPHAYAQYASDSIDESIDNIRSHAGLSKSVAIFSFTFQILTLLALSPLYLPHAPLAFIALAAVALVGTALLIVWLLLHVSLIRNDDGLMIPLNLANKFTIIRFLLIPPLIFLIVDERFTAALIVYVVCVATDVIDGFIARWRNERTQFGTVMDPLADVFSTGAVFAALLAQDFIPLWVFLLLMIRYGMLFLGSTILFFTTGPLKFRATVVGKIVGVLQATAVILIVGSALSGIDMGPAAQRYLFVFLGLIFCSVMVSQLVIGIRIIYKRSVNIGS